MSGGRFVKLLKPWNGMDAGSVMSFEWSYADNLVLKRIAENYTPPAPVPGHTTHPFPSKTESSFPVGKKE